MKWLLDSIFPPLCAACGETTKASLLCPACWAECAPVDPVGRCRHCFEEAEEVLCSLCVKQPGLFFPRAFVFQTGAAELLFRKYPEELAGYVLYQWTQLDWPLPDFIVPLPGKQTAVFAELLAEWLQVNYLFAFKRWSRTLIEDLIPEGATLLLLGTGEERVKHYEREIASAFPKKCFLVSLFAYDLGLIHSPLYRRPALWRNENHSPRTGLDR